MAGIKMWKVRRNVREGLFHLLSILFLSSVIICFPQLIANADVSSSTSAFQFSVSLTGGIAPASGRTSFKNDLTVYFKEGDKVILSGLPDGTGRIFIDNLLLIRVIQPDGTPSEFSYDFNPCCLPICVMAPLPPRDITSFFQPGKNKVILELRNACGRPLSIHSDEQSSWGIFLTRVTTISSFLDISNEMMTDLKTLNRRIYEFRKWQQLNEMLDLISKARDLAKLGLGSASRVSRIKQLISELTKKKAEVEPLNKMRQLLDEVREVIPELKSKVAALRSAGAIGENKEQRILKRLSDLLIFVCNAIGEGKNEVCNNIIVIYPLPVQGEVEVISQKLDEADIALDTALDELDQCPACDKQEIAEALKEAHARMSDAFQKIRAILDETSRKISKVAKELSDAVQWTQSMSYEKAAVSNDSIVAEVKLTSILKNGRQVVEFEVEGQGVAQIYVQILDLSGMNVFTGESFSNHLTFDAKADVGHALANGVYLCMVTVRSWDRTIIRSEIKKLVVLR